MSTYPMGIKYGRSHSLRTFHLKLHLFSFMDLEEVLDFGLLILKTFVKIEPFMQLTSWDLGAVVDHILTLMQKKQKINL